MNPDWQYMLWTDESLKERKFKWFSKVNQSLFAVAANYGEKSDILRLELLYQFGGVYVDMDFECVQSLDLLDCGAKSFDFMTGFSNTGLLEVNNAMIGCCPKHPVLVEIWKSVQLVCDDQNV